MKHFLYSILFLLFFATAHATPITVSSFQKPGYNYGGTTATIRVYLSQNYLTNDGKSLTAGQIGGPGFYLIINCTVSGTTLTVPSFVIDSTDNGAPNTGRYSFVLYDRSGTKRDTLYSNYRIPIAFGSVITIAQLVIWNTTASQPPRPGFPDTVQVQQMINAAGAGGTQKASDVVFGITRLDVAPGDPATPIAVGVNSPRALSVRGTVTLVDGKGTIYAEQVHSSASFFALSQSSNVSGSLQVDKTSIVDGFSVNISSSNLGDNGVVSWSILPQWFAAPSAPASCTAVVGDPPVNGQLIVSAPLVTGADTYAIWREGAGEDAFSLVARVSTFPYLDSGTPGTVYHYYIQALGIGGLSDPSPTATATAPLV